MFKDYKKYLSTSLHVYLLLLVIIFIMKLVGLDYFGLDLDNKMILWLSNLVSTNLIINNMIFVTMLFINQYIILSLAANDNSKKMIIYNLCLLPFSYILQGFKNINAGIICYFIELLYLIVALCIYKKSVKKEYVKRIIFIVLMTFLLQVISVFTRLHYSLEYVSNPVFNIILNLDYFVLLLIIYKLNFMKGDENLCGCQVEVGSFLLKKRHFSNSLKELQANYSSLNKQDKAAFIIYSILSLLWDIFTVIVVMFIAFLNDTVIECIFILTSFWISKRVFGKAFHLKSMIQCFILSNITYYVLNRVTTPIGISILVPIMLGVGLSYITSKFVKNYKPLYKGMPIEEFDRTILEVVEKDSDKYKICYDFFIKKENAILLGRKYNYTEAGIRKITARVNNKIKMLK